ncbi:hypothetical protein NMY22_g851 [Coprinellus aureogranulatus]|nr:hypothetical protein NMY22_g851 [Coprinellus aureogranulatus]
MPQLFDVPGWSVPESSTASTTKLPKSSKKRKRPASDTSSKLFSAEFNVEKIMEKLKETTRPKNDFAGKPSRDEGKKERKKKRKQGTKQHEEPTSEKPPLQRKISTPKPLQPRGKVPKDNGRAGQELLRPAKRHKADHASEDPSQKKVGKKTDRAAVEEESGLTVLQKRMKEKLDGAKFRMINETLYKSDSTSALRMVRENPSVYEEYHVGFRHQVHSWPTNPVEQYIAKLKGYPPRTVIADLGCGDAALARCLVPEGMAVLSYDLVSDGMYVVEADACKGIPLPGSGPTTELPMGEAAALMDIRDVSGELQIAEVASRFTDVKEFEKLVTSIGFRLTAKVRYSSHLRYLVSQMRVLSQDDKNTHFTLFEFKKVARKPFSEKEWSQVLGKASTLKPCEYKRR